MSSDAADVRDVRTPGTVAGCLFCGIVNREVPAAIVAERPLALAFRDILPQAPVHVLVVPRQHLLDATAVGSEHGATLADMFVLANEVAALEGVGESGFRLIMNIGEDGGNTVGHLHLHVLGGRAMGWPPG